MANLRAVVCATVFPALFGASAWAQSVISAHSGVIQYVEGDVKVDDAAVHPKFAEFPDVKTGQVLDAKEGRVEMLLTPGVFLRLAENSSVRMLSNALTDTRLEVVSGSALIEVGELLEHNAITFEAAGAHMALSKKGLYRIDASPARLRVYEGQAVVTAGSESLTGKKGHQIDLDAAKLADARFDAKDTDAFYRWCARRAEYVAAANVVSARVEANSDYSSELTNNTSAWSWNPYYGMYTYLPASGVYWSPFGAPFYSPGVVSMMYIPQRSISIANPSIANPSAVSPSAANLGSRTPESFGSSRGGVSPSAAPQPGMRMGGLSGPRR